MNIVSLAEIKLIGLSLKEKTTNANGQSHTDCKNLWHDFDNGKYADKISGKLSEEIFGVYHGYEKDHTAPFSYFIGCKVNDFAIIPEGLTSMAIPAGEYHHIVAKGKMPECMINAWKEVWASDIPRTYTTDFEVYDERSRNWDDAEVDVYLSVKN